MNNSGSEFEMWSFLLRSTGLELEVKLFQTVDLVSENVRNRRDGSVQPSCARASQSQGLEDLQYSYVYISLLVIRIQSDPELFPGSGIFSFRSSKNENENKLQFIYIFWPVNSQILDAGTKYG